MEKNRYWLSLPGSLISIGNCLMIFLGVLGIIACRYYAKQWREEKTFTAKRCAYLGMGFLFAFLLIAGGIQRIIYYSSN